jgi:hypothetical protein
LIKIFVLTSKLPQIKIIHNGLVAGKEKGEGAKVQLTLESS